MANQEENESNENLKNNKKKPMTDDERLALCEKLDKELEEFIDKLPKKKYSDGWSEDKWQEEIEKHPFFMKKAPEPGEELHPLYEGLQKLKYDPEENTPEDLAVAYKEDGNFNFKHKNYRLAILSYTEGIKAKCNDANIVATLYNNRAASHYFLKNYRSCLRDCELALKYKSNYDKVLLRAANSCFNMQQHDKCVEYCDLILDKDTNNKDVQQLRQKSLNAAKINERDSRKKEANIKKQKAQEQLLLDSIAKRNVKFDFATGKLTLDRLQPQVPQLYDKRVHFDVNNKNLVWPVTFVYPEYQIMDFVQEFSEMDTLLDHLQSVFETRPEWDTENKYKSDLVNVYFESNEKLFKINVKDNLKSILQHERFIIKSGTPSFILLAKGSKAEKEFLEKYNYSK